MKVKAKGGERRSRWNPYPFDEWFMRIGSGGFRLLRGRDYICQTHGMAQMVRSAASKRGIPVSIAIAADASGLRVMARKEPDAAPA